MTRSSITDIANGGLCSTCNERPTCIHYARRGPAIFCELFDTHAPRRIHRAETEPGARDDPPGRSAPGEETFKGLCVNCEHRYTCTYPMPPGGVWHCEDYI